MHNRREFLRHLTILGAVTSVPVHHLAAQNETSPKPEDAKLFAIHYGDEIHPSRPPTRKIMIPKVGEYSVLKGDFHTHSIICHGKVMPQDRVSEAINNGLDVIAITDAITANSFRAYPDIHNMIAMTNRTGDSGGKKLDQNLSYILAKPAADKQNLILIPAMELTFRMPPGHLNALFIKDANVIEAEKDWRKPLTIAAKQGAFIFWCHPGWVYRGDGLEEGEPMRFFDEHEEARLKGHLHGIEVFGQSLCMFYPVALDWCNEKDLAVLSNSDIKPSELERFGYQNPRRPITLVLAKERSLESVKEAFFAKRTIGWAANMIFGRPEWVEKLFRACVDIKKTETGSMLRNLSDIPCVIEANGKTSELLPQGSVQIGPAKKLIVTNWFIGAFKSLEISL